ncbi:MAG: 2-oxo acid dehydrogenase subunit E2 [Micromonosporaceae bacterium]
MIDDYQPLDGADRWFIDIMKSVEAPGFLLVQEVDMTATREIIGRLRRQGLKVTYTHVVMRAVALALARHPELNRLILGKQVVRPGTIDLSMSVGTGLSMAAEPTAVVQCADQLDLVDTYHEVSRKAAEVRAHAEEGLAQTRRLTRIIPFGWLRRWLIKRMKRRMSMIRERLGVFHVTSSPQMQLGVPFVFAGIGLIGICRVELGVMVRDAQPVVRPITRLCMVGDHRLWKAVEASTMINEVTKILETGELASEVPPVQGGRGEFRIAA